MTSTTHTIAFSGLNVRQVEVQAYTVKSTMPCFKIVGLPDKLIAESKERVKAAMSSIGLGLPGTRITINLAPADLVKEGTHFDLPVAMSLMADSGIIPQKAMEDFWFMGELSLGGKIAPISGVLPAAIEAMAQGKGIVCPVANAQEALWSGNEKVLVAKDLLSLIHYFKGSGDLPLPEKTSSQMHTNYPDMKDVKGQKIARRAMEIAAAGGHNILMNGPPGSGKSMLASRLPGIMPPPTKEEILDISMLASLTGQLPEKGLMLERPFRSPHHSASMAAMVGGGKQIKPGEITMSHRGVLFLDELPEFTSSVLESLRQPLETGDITISRAQSCATFPAVFLLVAAMNPCKCGYFGDSTRQCSKVPHCATQYQSKISGPLLDRFDIHMHVQAMTPQELQASKETPEDSATIARRVIAAREIQHRRYHGTNTTHNGKADGQLLYDTMKLTDNAQTLLDKAMDKLKLTMRGYHRMIRVARTIADLAASERIEQAHMAEAIGYRKI